MAVADTAAAINKVVADNIVAVEVAADTAAVKVVKVMAAVVAMVEVVIIMVVATITSTAGSHGTVITTEAVEVAEVMENEDSELEVKVAEEIGEINKSHELNLPAELNSPFIHRIKTQTHHDKK